MNETLLKWSNDGEAGSHRMNMFAHLSLRQCNVCSLKKLASSCLISVLRAGIAEKRINQKAAEFNPSCTGHILALASHAC